MCFHGRHVCLGRKAFSMLLCTVGVIHDSTSIFIPRDGYCTIDTYVYNVTVNFTVKILLANVEACHFRVNLITIMTLLAIN